MKIAAVVILYHPGTDLLTNIKSYASQVEKIFVFDNTETLTGIKEDLLPLPNVEYFNDEKNEGIAKRLNQGVERALNEGYDWLLTMDQDTFFEEGVIAQYISCISSFGDKNKAAMFGTAYSNQKQDASKSCDYIQAENLITSGMVLNLGLASKIGAFDENLFIDSVDHDYVIRAKRHGYLVIQFTQLFILHNIGQQVFRASIKTLFIVKKKKIVHAPLRCYYMYRNMLYLKNKYKNSDVFLAGRLDKIVTGVLLANFFYGRNAWKTFKYLLKARRDFKNNRMGKLGE